MAISATEARVRIDNINQNFDQASHLLSSERRPEFAAMRERVNKTLEARYAQLAAPITPARQQVRDAIDKHGREYVVAGIGAMVEVQTAEMKLDQAKAELIAPIPVAGCQVEAIEQRCNRRLNAVKPRHVAAIGRNGIHPLATQSNFALVRCFQPRNQP